MGDHRYREIMLLVALLAVATVRAAPLVPEIVKVHIVSGEGTALPTDENKIVLDAPNLYVVLEAVYHGRRHFYCGENSPDYLNFPPLANIGGLPRLLERWQSAAATPDAPGWGAPVIAWYWLDPYQLHQSGVGNDPTQPDYAWYTNVIANGKRERTWLGTNGVYGKTPEGNSCDVVEYIIPPAPAAQGWSTGGYHERGTMRFIATVTYEAEAGSVTLSSPGAFDPATISHLVYQGRGACYHWGVTAAVHRVSRRSTDPNRYLSYLDAYIGVPWLYGTFGASAATHQTERFVGADCANLLIGAARLAGLTRKGYANAQHLAKDDAYASPRVPFEIKRNAYDQLVNTATGEEVSIALGVGGSLTAYVGDLLLIDYDNNGTFKHSEVIRSDTNTNGLLDFDDTLVFMYHGGLSENLLGSEITRGDAFRLRHW